MTAPSCGPLAEAVRAAARRARMELEPDGNGSHHLAAVIIPIEFWQPVITALVEEQEKEDRWKQQMTSR